MAAVDLAAQAIDEVRQLHAFFVGWFRGETGAAFDFAACDGALAADFRMVTPDGAVHERAAVVERLPKARGSAADPFTIKILHPHVAWRSGDAVLLEFIERQYRDGRETSRRSTGLFTADSGAPRGVVWRHLQETWMQSVERATDQMRPETLPRRGA